MQAIDWRIGRWLRVVSDAKLYKRFGYRSLALYTTNRLGFCLRKARMLIALDRRSSTIAPQLIVSYRRGEISCARALLLLPVICTANASRWIERAQEVTVRSLSAEVAWAVERIECGVAPFLVLPPGDVDVDKVQIGDGLADHAGQSLTPRCVPASATIAFRAPISVVTSMSIAVEAFSAGGEPRWRGLERLLEHVRLEWESQPRHRDPIFERDDWRCTVPACTSRRNLHDHHVVFKSRGGDNELSNRTTVCAGHHHQAIHAEKVRAVRASTGEILWWLGVGEGVGGQAFLRLRGDRYVERQTLKPSVAMASNEVAWAN
jgi:hypothetical protein